MAKIAKAGKEQNSSYRINKDKLSTFIQYLNATCFKSLHSICQYTYPIPFPFNFRRTTEFHFHRGK